MKRLTKAELARSLHASGRTVPEIAATLDVRPDSVEVWLGVVSGDDLHTSAAAQNDYARRFRGVLRFRDVQAARESVARIDVLYREFVEAGDRRGVHQAQLMALVGKNRCEGIGKDDCARLFGEWLVGHLWMPRSTQDV